MKGHRVRSVCIKKKSISIYLIGSFIFTHNKLIKITKDEKGNNLAELIKSNKKLLNEKDSFIFYTKVGAVWLLLWIFTSFINNADTFVPQSLNEIWRVLFLVAANYIFFEYSLPFIRRKRSIIFFNVIMGIFLISVHVLVLSVVLYGWRYLGILLHIYTVLRHVTFIEDTIYYHVMDGIFYQAEGGVTSFFFFGMAKLFYYNFKLRQTAQQQRLEMQEAELNYLKSQTNPHFLFNTLNNIYSLTRDKSELAPESILRLSEILRFMLYETGGKHIAVEQEIKIINDYIALEKLRYDESLKVTVNFDIEDMKQSLPPLLLIPLVENAFKHGVSETRIHPFVNILLAIKNDKLIFIVKNSFEGFTGDMKVKENLGLSNLRRQLELLYAEFNLSFQQEESLFTTTLEINLATYVYN